MSTAKLKLPTAPKGLIDTRDALLEICAHLHNATWFTFDTEFIGESSYQPVLCLIQVATNERVELIDPFALDDLAPFWQLVADPAILKIVHAGDQDLAIAFQQGQRPPANVLDSQIAAGMVGLGYPLAYWRLVELYAGVSLEKAHTFSAWDRRPLSKEQFHYAIDDVRYLPLVWEALAAHMEHLGHTAWMREAADELCAKAGTPVDPRAVYKRLKGANSLQPVQLAALREVAALREQLAFEHDMPVRQMFKDEALIEIALRMPRKEADLAAIRLLPREEIVTYGEQLLAAVERGRALPAEQRPRLPGPVEDDLETKRIAELLWVATQMICLGQSVSPSLVTSQGEVLTLARRIVEGRSPETHDLMTGWHREALGEKLVAFVEGKLSVDVKMEARELRAKFTP